MAENNFDDPYEYAYSQTPIRPKQSGGTSNNIKNPKMPSRIFNPYEEQKKDQDEDLPDNIDLTKNVYAKQTSSSDSQDEENEAPLLEELGISPQNIKQKFISVLTFHKIDRQILEDADMSGPFLIFILFGVSLALQTKTHFGYLYGLSIFGSILICNLINLMNKKDNILLYNTISVLGYCMLPVVILSFISVFIVMKSIIGTVLCFITIILSSFSATRFFEIESNMREQRWLIFYPVMLFYTCFVLLTIV